MKILKLPNKTDKTSKINKKCKINKKNVYSKEFKKYRQKRILNKLLVILIQILLLAGFIIAWELLANAHLINTFIFSSPSRIWQTLKDYNFFLKDIVVTLNEALISFAIATLLGTLIAIILWCIPFMKNVLDPYIVVLNSLPKIALGPMIIIWVGIGTSAIVFMAVLIMIIITVLSMLQNFMICDKNKIMLLESMNASKMQILFKLILPNSLPEFMSVLKINVGLTWVGTIMGEYLVSRAGLGYQIMYGSQVFKMNLIMSSVILLCVLAGIMYFVVSFFEKLVYKNRKR